MQFHEYDGDHTWFKDTAVGCSTVSLRIRFSDLHDLGLCFILFLFYARSFSDAIVPEGIFLLSLEIQRYLISSSSITS